MNLQTSQKDGEDNLYEESEDTQKNRFLTFRVGKEGYGIEIGYIMEIIGIQRITEVPDKADFIKGVINLRRQVIPVMDVRVRFGFPEREYDDRTCIVVVKVEEHSVGLIVDTVREVVDIPEDDISANPAIGNRKDDVYIRGLGKLDDEVNVILDVPKLLFEEDGILLQLN
jgi:purine-binding chemotaxis protein CheW